MAIALANLSHNPQTIWFLRCDWDFLAAGRWRHMYINGHR